MATVPSDQRQFVRFALYKLSQEWWTLRPEDRARSIAEFEELLVDAKSTSFLRSYSLLGLRADVDFMLWQADMDLKTFQDFQILLQRTPMGRYLTTTHSFLSQTRRSIYVDDHVHEGQDGQRLRLTPSGTKYLFVYPFVKTRAWYALPQEERQRQMNEHIRVGHKYTGVKINTTYSYGIDDQEFVVAFEADDPSEFLDLVMELRLTEASSYTLRDTPMFTCVSVTIAELMDQLCGYVGVPEPAEVAD
jgi:chlorite dismutase